MGGGRVEMRNRIRGEHQDVRDRTGDVNDAGFGVMRDSFGETCGAVGPKLAPREPGWRFASRWIAP